MSKQIFINLPVRNLTKSIAFYEALGATRNPQFSDDTASCMVISDSIFVMLLTHAKWSTFTKKPIVDAHKESEVALALGAESRSAVDQFAEAAGGAGGNVDVNPKQDLGFMYARSVEDLDGHVWECVYVDMGQVPKG